MPQHVRLANGAALDVPAGMSGDRVTALVQHMNAIVDPQWKGWSDPIQSARNVMSYVTNPAERVATAALNFNPYVGGYDLTAGAVNALKAVASKYAPSLGSVPDLPDISQTVGNAAGTPPMPTDAAPVQRYGEAAITGALNPKAAIGGALKMVGATGFGDIGSSIASYFGGPEWEKAGRWLGSVAGATPNYGGGPRTLFAGKQAPAVAQAGRDLGVQPSFGSLANTPGKLLEGALGNFPGVGMPVHWAQERVTNAVEGAKSDAAEGVNQGPVSPQVDPTSIGGGLINLARNKVQAIRDDFKQRYNALTNAVDPKTLVDARPIVDAITAQANNPNLSAAQKADVLARVDYLKSMTPGQPGYSGPQYSGPLATTPTNSMVVPLGQLNAFRTELGDDIGAMRGLDRTVQGPVRDAITNATQNAYDQKGYGQQYRDLNADYASKAGAGGTIEALEAIGGSKVPGASGNYTGGMNEQQASNFLQRNTRSPSELAPIADPNDPAWRGVASQFIENLGNTGPNGAFNMKDFGKGAAKITDPVLAQYADDPSTQARIRSAQTLAQNAAPPSSAAESVPGFLGVEAMIDWLGGHHAAIAYPALAALAAGMQSKPMTDYMSQPRTDTSLADAVYSGFPYAASSLSLNNPDDPNNQNLYAPRPPSPLDQLNPPAPTPPPPAHAQ
jgi:hypothetical protein